MLQFIIDFEYNDNSEPTIIDSVDPAGSPWGATFLLCKKGILKTGDRRRMPTAAFDTLIIKEITLEKNYNFSKNVFLKQNHYYMLLYEKVNYNVVV